MVKIEKFIQKFRETILNLLLAHYFLFFPTQMNSEGVCIRFIGDLSPLPKSLQQLMYQSMETTKNNQAVYFNVAINYGSRLEIIKG